MQTPVFPAQASSFHAELRRRVNQYFQENGISPTGNAQLYLKAVLITVAYIAIYVHLVFFTPHWALALVECIVLGGLTAAIGFNIMHDGAHGSFSRHNWINDMAGLSLNFLGANVFMWKTKHNVVHHTYTNIAEVDDDIDARPMLRMCESQAKYKIHRYQHLYFWFAYSLLYLYWVFFTDYEKYFTKRVGNMPLAPMKLRDHISFWAFKVFHFIAFVLVPIHFVGFVPWLIGFVLYGAFCGVVLSIVFQLAHVVEATAFPKPNPETNRLEDEWAIHQVRTTANFATRNKVVGWLTGGLNFQVEHHLFPKISHVHYPALNQIVKQVCEEFNVRYNEYRHMREAVGAHVRHLRALGA
jgi:linoleoyl-CoA desaturase